MDVRVGLQGKLSTEELMLLNCGVGEDSESPLDCKEFQPVHPKGDQSWVFIGRTDVEAETPILWPPDVKSWLIWKDRNAGKDWRREKGMREDEMAGWHHWLDGHEFEWAPGVGDGQGSLACCSPCGHKESDTTERLNWTELMKSGQSDSKIHSHNHLCQYVPVLTQWQWELEEEITWIMKHELCFKTKIHHPWWGLPETEVLIRVRNYIKISSWGFKKI